MGEKLASCQIFMCFIYFHKQAVVSGHLPVLFIGISIELIITVSECLSLFMICHLSLEGRTLLLSALKMAFHRDKVEMNNAFCTWHLVTWLFGEMQVFNHTLKHRIWAQLHLFWTVPFSPNIKSISKKQVGREQKFHWKISKCSSSLLRSHTWQNIFLKEIQTSTMALGLVDSSPVRLHFKHVRVFQHPRELFFSVWEGQNVSWEAERWENEGSFMWLTLSSIFPNCHELTYPVRVTLIMNPASSGPLKKGLRFVFLHKTARKMQLADKWQIFGDKDPSKVPIGERISKNQ